MAQGCNSFAPSCILIRNTCTDEVGKASSWVYDAVRRISRGAAMTRMKRLLPVFTAILVVAAIFGTLASCSSGPSMPGDAKAAIDDAAAFADDLAAHFEGYMQSFDTENGLNEQSSASKDDLDQYLSRIQADIDAIESSQGIWVGREEALIAMKNLKDAVNYEKDIVEAQKTASSAATGEGSVAAMEIIDALYGAYKKIDPPDCLRDYLDNTLETLPTIYSALIYNATGPDSTLSQFTYTELLTWWFTKQVAYDNECTRILIKQCNESHDELASILSGKVPGGSPTVELDIIDEIAPNLYQSLDSAALVGVTSYDGNHNVNVEAEIVGFSQKFEQKYKLAQGYNYLPIKPALLPEQQLPNLANNSTTQMNVKVTDADSGEVLAQESHSIDLLSIYDFKWSNDEFGATAAFDIMAWLRPQADEVNKINREAADVLGDWTNGQYRTIAGYQYGTDALATLYQVAAIQKAISDNGVVYVMDNYSYKSDQHVLTPDAVVQKKQGLCIETSLLMSSCLMSAGMHPLIILSPGHAQVAVETYSGSGNYFLIETTTLPYDGLNLKLSETEPAFYNGLLASAKTETGDRYYWTLNGTSDEWETYFNYISDGSDEFGGVFVIDCNLQPVMGIQGLENI